MLRNVPAVLAVLALALAIGGCSAKSPKPAKQTYINIDQVYAAYDANGDGKITKEEFTAKFQQKQKADTAWKKIDKSNNGFVERTLNDDEPLRVWNDVESQNEPY